jgi:hypothetical protein
MKTILICLSLFLTGRVTAETLDLVAETKKFNQLVQSPSFNINNCARILKQSYELLVAGGKKQFDLEEIRKFPRMTTLSLQKARLELRKKIRSFYLNGELVQGSEEAKKCLFAARDMYNAGRFMEEYVINTFLETSFLGKKIHHFTRPSVNLVKVPGFPADDYRKFLKSGDVILTRGTSFVSATIVQIGVQNVQYSHLGLIHIENENDPKRRKVYILESLIESNVGVRTFQEFLDSKPSRIAVFRQKDREKAKAAAEYMYRRVIGEKRPGGIPYDFAMDDEDNSKLFCAEVVLDAYAQAGLKVPFVMTSYNLRNRDILDSFGVGVTETFAPADIEIDPRFELTLEWRDSSRIYEEHKKDAITRTMFRWMEDPQLDYTFVSNFLKADLMAYAGYYLRRIPLLKKIVDDQVSMYIGIEQIRSIKNVEILGNILYAQLEKERRHNFGHELSAEEMDAFLEKLRVEDLERFRKGEKGVLFHSHFRTRE